MAQGLSPDARSRRPNEPPSFSAEGVRRAQGVGLTLARARMRIRRAGGPVGRIKRVRSRRVGRVIAQQPSRGAKMRQGGRVRVTLGRR